MRALRVYVLTCFARLRAWRACVLTCLRAKRACVLTFLTCLRAYVLLCMACLHAWRVYVLSMLACLRAWYACVRACVRAWLLRWNVLFSYVFAHLVFGVLFCLIFFTFQYLDLKILRAKKLCALLSWTYFLFTFWYQLIKLYETNLRVAGKSIDISYSYSCSKAISIFYNLYIHLLH